MDKISHPIVKALFITEIICFFANTFILFSAPYNFWDIPAFISLKILSLFALVFFVVYLIETIKKIYLCNKRYYIFSFLMQSIAIGEAFFVAGIGV